MLVDGQATLPFFRHIPRHRILTQAYLSGTVAAEAVGTPGDISIVEYVGVYVTRGDGGDFGSPWGHCPSTPTTLPRPLIKPTTNQEKKNSIKLAVLLLNREFLHPALGIYLFGFYCVFQQPYIYTSRPAVIITVEKQMATKRWKCSRNKRDLHLNLKFKNGSKASRFCNVTYRFPFLSVLWQAVYLWATNTFGIWEINYYQKAKIYWCY